MTTSRIQRSLRRYQVVAYVVGSLLSVLAFVALPLTYLADRPTLGDIGWPIHGALYVFYVLATLDLAVKLRWRWTRTVLVMLAGTVPIMTFVAERHVTHGVRGPALTR